jgi:ectoine hydroxylase-related dioxygenase (phytanoyl-CoA dioxygenase family)
VTAAAEYDIDAKVLEFRINGFAVFEDLIPHAKIDRILEAWEPVRDAGIERQGENPSRGWGRYNVRVPFREPFVDPEIFEHPAVVAFVRQALGDDYVWTHFDSNIPLPGTDYQNWHRDGRANLFPGIMTPVPTIGVKFPLCDTSEKNGSFEVMPCTQYVGELPAENLDDLFGHGAAFSDRYTSRRLNLSKGSLWIHDNRVIHRGTPNRSDRPRDELCMAMSSSWVFSRWQHENTQSHFSRELWDSLSNHARQVLRWQRLEE